MPHKEGHGNEDKKTIYSICSYILKTLNSKTNKLKFTQDHHNANYLKSTIITNIKQFLPKTYCN